MSAPTLPKVLPPVVALVGDEMRAKEQLLAEIVERAGKDAAVVMWNVDPHDKPERELSRLLTDLCSRPLFGGTRVVVVRDGDGLLKRLGAGLDATLKKDAGNRLVLMLNALDARTRLGRALKSSGGVLTCARPKAAVDGSHTPASGELLNALKSAAAAKGLVLDLAAASELVGRTGNDLMLLDGELEKLKTYTAGTDRVTRDDVSAVVPRSAAWDQFKLFDEIGRGDLKAAVQRMAGMLREGTADRGGKRVTDPRAIAMTVLYALQRRLRLLAGYRRLKARGAAQEEIQRELNIRNPGQLYYLGKEASLPLVAAAERSIPAFLTADRDLKSSADPSLVIDRLLVQLASLARPKRSVSAGGRPR